MTGTSRALRRLGVAGLSAVVATVGLGTLGATSALAAVGPTTHVALDKHTDTAAVGTCNAFTATIDPDSTVTVQITQALPNNSVAGDEIGFCTPANPKPDADDSGPNGTTATPGTTFGDTTVAGNACYNGTAAVGPPPATKTVSCYTTYTDSTGVNTGNGKVVFGVYSTYAGSMNIQAYGDTNGNGTHDVPGEPGDAATKTWVANSTTDSTDKISCTPPTAQNPTGTTHKFTCNVTNASGVALNNAEVEFKVTSGPDGPNGAFPGDPGASSGLGTYGATCTTTGDNYSGDPVAGEADCQYNNNGHPGHDVIYVWIEQNGTSDAQASEPNTQITKDWLLAAPSSSDATASCSPNEVDATPPAFGYSDATCQEGTQTKTTTLTAKVTNGSPAQPVSGAIVQFGDPYDNGGPADAGDTESLSAHSCTTGSDGSCSVTLTDSNPTDGEDLGVDGTVSLQGGGNLDLSWFIDYHNPDSGEARNITVSPASATQPSGGSQDEVAKVTDRFGNPVKGVCVGWDETGPGHFTTNDNVGCFISSEQQDQLGTYATTCVTGAAGTCQVTVVTQNGEAGDESITATIDPANYDGTTASTGATECQAAAGFSFYNSNGNFNENGTNPNANGGNNVATGAPAGNCTASSKVSWGSVTPPPTGKTHMKLKLSCFSRHPHVIKCVAQTIPAKSGLTVVFFNKRGHRVGIDTTNAAGKAHLKLRHKKSGHTYTYQAHLRHSKTTYSADSRRANVTVQ